MTHWYDPPLTAQVILDAIDAFLAPHANRPALSPEELQRITDQIKREHHTHIVVVKAVDDDTVIASLLWHRAGPEVMVPFADEVKEKYPAAIVMAGECHAWVCLNDDRPRDVVVWLERG